jgi:hypothetical protein
MAVDYDNNYSFMHENICCYLPVVNLCPHSFLLSGANSANVKRNPASITPVPRGLSIWTKPDPNLNQWDNTIAGEKIKQVEVLDDSITVESDRGSACTVGKLNRSEALGLAGLLKDPRVSFVCYADANINRPEVKALYEAYKYLIQMNPQ